VITVEQFVEWMITNENTVLEVNVPGAAVFTTHLKYGLTSLEPGPPRWEANDQPSELQYSLQLQHTAYIDSKGETRLRSEVHPTI
jgi:hypothetical protein